MKLFAEKFWMIDEQNDLCNLHMFDFKIFDYVNNPGEADIIVQTSFNPFRNQKGKKILVNMEPPLNFNPVNYNNYDIIISTHLNYPDISKVIYYPFTFHHLHSFKNVHYVLNRHLYFKKENKKKFCLFIGSNDRAWQRMDFFKKLSEYKHIDSKGGVFQNSERMSYPHYSPKFLDIIREYKFMICFENSDCDGYATEKITNAYLGDTIPIYWGNKRFYNYLNKKSLVLLEEYNEENINRSIEEIIELDNNDELYYQKIKEPLFFDNKVPEEFTLESIRSKILSRI
jgi:hypothetical protein